MSLSKAAEKHKENFIKWATMKHGLDFYDHVNLSDCTDGFVFDADIINDDGIHALTEFDMTWSLESVCARAAEDMEDDEIVANLQLSLAPLISQPELAAEVTRLMEQELKESDQPQKLWKAKALKIMASYLAIYRAEKGKIRMSTKYKNNARKYEFKVFLKTLHYGYSEILDNTELFFNYNTPFHEFLRALREQTLLCTIPPRIFQKKDLSSEKEQSKTRETSKTFSIHEGKQEESTSSHPNASNSLVDEVPTNNDVFPPQEKAFEIVTQSRKAKMYQSRGTEGSATQTPPESQAAGRPRDLSEKGYSLSDGPWRYKIIIKNRLAAPFLDIANEDGYNSMLDRLKALGLNGSERNKVIIMHSMDRDAFDIWNMNRAEEKKENDRRTATLTQDPEHDSVEDGDNYEETYCDWMLREAIAQSKASKDPWPSSRAAPSGIRHPRSSSPPLTSSPVLRDSSSPASSPIIIND